MRGKREGFFLGGHIVSIFVLLFSSANTITASKYNLIRPPWFTSLPVVKEESQRHRPRPTSLQEPDDVNSDGDFFTDSPFLVTELW